MIIDTDVLIWYMCGNKKAYELIEDQSGFFTSVVNYIELVWGMRNKTERIEIRRAFREWYTKILYINEEISAKAMFYIERHYLSHSLQLADAMIGSTALVNGRPILTGNDKHYKMIKEVEIIRFNL